MKLMSIFTIVFFLCLAIVHIAISIPQDTEEFLHQCFESRSWDKPICRMSILRFSNHKSLTEEEIQEKTEERRRLLRMDPGSEEDFEFRESLRKFYIEDYPAIPYFDEVIFFENFTVHKTVQLNHAQMEQAEHFMDLKPERYYRETVFNISGETGYVVNNLSGRITVHEDMFLYGHYYDVMLYPQRWFISVEGTAAFADERDDVTIQYGPFIESKSVDDEDSEKTYVGKIELHGGHYYEVELMETDEDGYRLKQIEYGFRDVVQGIDFFHEYRTFDGVTVVSDYEKVYARPRGETTGASYWLLEFELLESEDKVSLQEFMRRYDGRIVEDRQSNVLGVAGESYTFDEW